MSLIFRGIFSIFFYLFHRPFLFINRKFEISSNWAYYKFKKKLKHLGSGTKFWKGVIIHGPDEVSIGCNTGIGDYVVIWGAGGVEIGNDVLIAANSVIASQSHDVNALVYRLSYIKKKIVIGNNVWLGAGVLVMPGVTIGNNSIIGAGSVVTRNIPQNSIAVGAPAVVIKQIKC